MSWGRLHPHPGFVLIDEDDTAINATIDLLDHGDEEL